MRIMAETESPPVSKSETTEVKSQEVEGSEETKTDDKNDFFTKITNNDITGVSNDLTVGLAEVDMQDEHGMTALMHAAYRGNEKMCDILLDHGADVNGGSHNNGYTALHFAGLSGNAGLCQILLQKGANPMVKNSVGRTPAQMAAFVGNHNCVATINSFVDRKDVEYFAVPQGMETTPKLDPMCVSSLHNLIMQVNFHPVRVSLTVRKNAILITHLESVIKVLEQMAEREMKKGIETNEIAAFKMHCLAQTLKFLQLEVTTAAEGKDPVDSFIHKLLRCDSAGGIPEGLDRELRECVKSFPFIKTAVMQQLVANLAQLQIGEDPGAWSVIKSVVNGHKGFQDNDPCATCGEESNTKKCARCHYDGYCDQECQLVHWFVHKKYCKQKAAEHAKLQASQRESTKSK
ncbi:unnamed protein product [Orchesella dallaii]|uniref:MYND-type domain-containing protein n=1 Tax=Orchesella dallaii TaxID=48710 RepID=A0ABP1RL22_9HEXA